MAGLESEARLLGASLGLAGHLEHIARHLDRVRSRALALEGLTPRDVEVLNALGRAGPPYRLSQGQLARSAQLTSGGMTGQADRMELAGWVTRSPDPDDRRGVLICLTEAGQAVLQRSLGTYLGDADRALAVLDTRDRAALAVLLARVVSGLSEEPPPGSRRGGS
ncbi:MAG TPA: MarR family transcriptional regulator [Actinomycetota bacterium]|nr:MarR family transcriptional regulator [Actinomycetota bacterium]